MIVLPTVPDWPMVPALCAWCHCFPCLCPRTEPCACGGMLVATSPNDETIRFVVAQHNASDLHRVWRDVREVWTDFGDKPLPIVESASDNWGIRLPIDEALT